MKVIVLHGDHTLDSYNRLKKFTDVAKKRNWQVVKIFPKDSLTLPEKLSGTSLFEEKQFYIVQDLKKFKTKELSWLKKNIKNLSGNLVIYYEGTIPKTLLKNLPQPDKIEEFKLPRLIFKFLESFYPKNARNCLKLFHQVIKTEPPEFVFSLLASYLRDVFLAKIDKKSLTYPSWRVSKLSKQAGHFSKNKLKNIISFLAEEDFKIKTSKAEITDSLDFIIASELE